MYIHKRNVKFRKMLKLCLTFQLFNKVLVLLIMELRMTIWSDKSVSNQQVG